MKKFIIFVAAVAMVGAFVATAMADVSLYGSARFRTYYANVDNAVPGVDDDSDLEWRIGHLTRFGANFKSDKITGKFEMDARAGGNPDADGGTNPGTATNTESSGASLLGNMRLRQLWGQYDFGSWKFMIGQNYPLYDAPASGLNYYSGGLQKFGGIGYDVARSSQMRFTINNLRIAFLQADTSKGGLTDPTGGGNDFDDDQDVILPKIEVRYDMKGDWGVLNFIGGYQTYKAVNDADSDQSINSWVAGIRGKFNFGPAYLGASLTYRQNGGNYGAWTTVDETAKFDGFDVQDATAYGGVFALGYKINDSNTLEASYGYVSSDQDLAGNWEDKKQAFGLMWKYTVAPGFYIVPEFIYQDNKSTEDGTGSIDNGDTTIFGVFWRIDFK